jgi:hypothetical protein
VSTGDIGFPYQLVGLLITAKHCSGKNKTPSTSRKIKLSIYRGAAL